MRRSACQRMQARVPRSCRRRKRRPHARACGARSSSAGCWLWQCAHPPGTIPHASKHARPFSRRPRTGECRRRAAKTALGACKSYKCDRRPDQIQCPAAAATHANNNSLLVRGDGVSHRCAQQQTRRGGTKYVCLLQQRRRVLCQAATDRLGRKKVLRVWFKACRLRSVRPRQVRLPRRAAPAHCCRCCRRRCRPRCLCWTTCSAAAPRCSPPRAPNQTCAAERTRRRVAGRSTGHVHHARHAACWTHAAAEGRAIAIQSRPHPQAPEELMHRTGAAAMSTLASS